MRVSILSLTANRRMVLTVFAALVVGIVALLDFGTQEANAQTKESSPAIKERAFTVPASGGSSVPIYVREKFRDNGTRVPVLLVHGTWGNSQTWDFPDRSVMNHLAGLGYDVYALDLRGMGQSWHPPDGDYSKITLASRVEDLRAVATYINTQAGRKPVVMGWSQGGVLTGLLATQYPDLVQGVGLFSIPHGRDGLYLPDPFPSIVQSVLGAYLGYGHCDYTQGDCDRWIPQPELVYAIAFWTDPKSGKHSINDKAFATFLQMTEEDSVQAVWDLINTQPSSFPDWGKITVPALVVDGQQDLIVGNNVPGFAGAQALYDALVRSPKKKLIIFPKNAHGWFLEDNYEDTQSEALDDFLKQF